MQEVLKAAADEKGEWYLPLDPEQVRRLQQRSLTAAQPQSSSHAAASLSARCSFSIAAQATLMRQAAADGVGQYIPGRHGNSRAVHFAHQ